MSVCDDHSKKRRSDPQNPGSYVRICDDCDKKYINKMILDEFKGKLKRRDEELKDLESKSNKLQKNFKEKQSIYDNQVSEVLPLDHCKKPHKITLPIFCTFC